MEKIQHPESYEICAFDGITASTVYKGSFSNLSCISRTLIWREDDEAGELCYKPYKVLTLEEITKQMTNLYGGKCPMLTIFNESPLSGSILQYGNYGDSWYKIGDLNGYA